MRTFFILTAATVGLMLGGCDGGGEKRSSEAEATAAATAERSPQRSRGRPPSDEGRDEQGGAIAYRLTPRGLDPGLSFGMGQAEVVAIAQKSFGVPTGSEHASECGGGPMDMVSFRGLSLVFQDGRFAGWALSEKLPDLSTSRGLGIRSPRSALGDAPIDRESTLDPEFSVDGVGGLLDDKEREVIALWAGLTCHFR